MTNDECLLAIERGRELISNTTAGIIGIGEMGIGNSSSACAIACATLNLSVAEVVGIGTGIGQKTLQRKTQLIQKALKKHQEHCISPLQVLQRLGGYEIAGLVGLLLEAADRSLPVVLDGHYRCCRTHCRSHKSKGTIHFDCWNSLFRTQSQTYAR